MLLKMYLYTEMNYCEHNGSCKHKPKPSGNLQLGDDTWT